MNSTESTAVTLTFFSLIVIWLIWGYWNDSRNTQKLTLFNQLPIYFFGIGSVSCIVFMIFLIYRVEQNWISVSLEIILVISAILFAIPCYWIIEITLLSKNISISKTKQGILILRHNERTIELNKETVSKLEILFSWFKSPLPTFTIVHLKTGEKEIINSLICDSTIFENHLKDVRKSEHEYNYKDYRELLKKIKTFYNNT